MFVYLAPVSRKGEIGKDRTSQPEVVRVPAAVRAAEGLLAGPPSVSSVLEYGRSLPGNRLKNTPQKAHKNNFKYA